MSLCWPLCLRCILDKQPSLYKGWSNFAPWSRGPGTFDQMHSGSRDIWPESLGVSRGTFDQNTRGPEGYLTDRTSVAGFIKKSMDEFSFLCDFSRLLRPGYDVNKMKCSGFLINLRSISVVKFKLPTKGGYVCYGGFLYQRMKMKQARSWGRSRGGVLPPPPEKPKFGQLF